MDVVVRQNRKPPGGDVLHAVQVVGRILGVVAAKVSVQHGFVGLGITLIAGNFIAGKPTVQRDRGLHVKRRLPIAGTAIGLVYTRRHPDFKSRARRVQGVLQIVKGRCPTTPVTAGGGISSDV